MKETQNSSGAGFTGGQGEAAVLARVRRFLLLILILEMLGISAELLLAGHTEKPWQWVPIVLISATLLALGWVMLDRRAAPIQFVQTLMALFILSGFVGTLLHYRAKAEFQLEVNPSLAGAALFWEAMKSQAPPSLAPGVMIQMGLLGFAFAYRHPALRKERKK
ncbi:MAG: hypothetical protein A3F68_02005 [Acidobacteria bacterium RIFCSPLOWO2_12_FULL_54_10]|nr:MAG: hypothetical protein A3F68_02005 [Acidobacteria bacterium RIFCSPLOWO2_12_FULL_54_10]